MSQPVNWSDIVKPLDLAFINPSPNYILRWNSFERTSAGILLQAEMASGQPVHFKVDVITSDVIRMRANPERIREEGSYMLVQNTWQPPAFDLDINETDDAILLSTDRIRLEIQKSPWQVRVYDRSNPDYPFFSQRIDDRSYGPNFESLPVGFDSDEAGGWSARETVEINPGESFYGFGEKFTPLDKMGQELISWAIDAGSVTSHRSYKNVPFFMSSAGYGIFVHSSFPMVYRMGVESSATYSFHIADSQLDYFLIYGPSFKHILKRYTNLTGRAPVPPKWSFGFWISRCMYESRSQIEAVMRTMREKDFPCDVLSLDPMWMGAGPWSDFEWDEELFPDPQDMIRKMRAQGLRLCLWVNPYIPEGTDLHKEGLEKGYFLRKDDGSISPAMEAFAGGELAAIDFSEPEQTAWYLEKLEKLLEQGVSVFKTDFGEQAPIDARYANGRSGLEMHNLYPLLYNGAVFDLTKRKFGRGLTWGRSGYAGSQRYPVQWGGDSYASSAQMVGQIRGLLGYGLSGIPFCSHDAGGFDYPPHAFDSMQVKSLDIDELMLNQSLESYPRDPAVYIRWLQFGVFSSHLRAHGKGPREPWEYGPEVETIARRYLKLRYRLLPYIYSNAWRSAETGLPMVRPMVLEYQDDLNTRRLDMQYLFGEDFMVALIADEARPHPVYLPAGEWIEYWSKTLVQGSQWIEVNPPLETLPLWVRRGAIIPMGPEMQFVGQKITDPLTLEFYYPQGKGAAIIHDEDQSDIAVHYTCSENQLILETSAAPGEIEIILYGVTAQNAVCNGVQLTIETQHASQVVRVDGRQSAVITIGLKETKYD
jgi:alpha-D-xyloside xylohydrolase